MIAAHLGNEDIVKLLIKHGPNPTLKDRYGKTAAGRAKSKKILALIQGISYSETSNKTAKPDAIQLEKVQTQLQKSPTVQLKAVKKGMTKAVHNLINEEVNKGEKCIREVISSELVALTEKVKDNMEKELQHKAGITDTPVFADIYPPTFMVPSQNKDIAQNQFTFAQKSHDSDKDLPDCSVSAIPPLEKHQRTQSHILARKIALEHLPEISARIENRLNSLEQILRNDLKAAIGNMTRELLSRIDQVCESKALSKEQTSPRRKSMQMAKDEPLADLHFSIAELERKYKEMIQQDTPEKYLGQRSKSVQRPRMILSLNFASPSPSPENCSRMKNGVRRGSTSALMVTQSSLMNSKGAYRSMENLVKDGNEVRVDYRFVKTHDAKVTPIAGKLHRTENSLPPWENSGLEKSAISPINRKEAHETENEILKKDFNDTNSNE